MKYTLIRPRTALITAVAVLSLSLCACRGRRASDMTPSGDTVEVIIDRPASEDESNGIFPDSTQFNDSTPHEF